MKTLNGIINWVMIWFAVLALVLVTGSCSESDNDDSGDVTFPELKTLTVNADSDAELTFAADADWVLSSNNSWCRFVDGDFAESTISGKAGNQKISIRVTDADQNYEKDDEAEISMKMGDKVQVVYKVIRPHKGISGLTVKDENGQVLDAEHPLLIKGGNIISSVETAVTLEFDDSNAELGVLMEKSALWVTITKTDGVTGGYDISFNEKNPDGKNSKYAIPAASGAVITFAAQKNGKVLTETAIPIYYDGLAANALVVKPTYMNVTASADGKTLTGEGGISGTENTDYGSELVSIVTTRNDVFGIVEIVPAVYDDKGNLESDFDFSANGDLDWVKTEITGASNAEIKDRVKLTVSPLSEESETRHAMVLLFPGAIYEIVKNDLKGNLIDKETGDIKSKYTTYIMARLTQEKKNGQSEEGVSFAGYYYTNFDGDAMAMTFEEVVSMDVGLELKMENISNSPESDAIYSKWASVMPKKNIWKATVPTALMGDTNNRLGIEAVGMSESAVLEEASPENGIVGEIVSAPTMAGQMVSLWSIYLTDGGKPAGYQVIVKNPSGIIDAVCVVEITD